MTTDDGAGLPPVVAEPTIAEYPRRLPLMARASMGRPANVLLALLRWILVVPAAVVALYFVALVSATFTAIVLGWLHLSKDTIVVLVNAVVIATALPALVNTAAIVAPKFRAVVGALLLLAIVPGYVTGSATSHLTHWFLYLVLTLTVLGLVRDLVGLWIAEHAGAFDEPNG